MALPAEQANQDLADHVIAAARATRDIDADATGFIALLLAHGIADDLAQYSYEDVAAVALDAWEHLQRRKPGRHKIRIANPDISVLSEYGWRTPVTVIDITNDNMPFLVDSVMSELQDRGLKVHLALHPLLAVPRDKAGRRTGPVAEGKPGDNATEGVVRESHIHIHVERMERAAARKELAESLSGVLDDCRMAVNDWPAMLARLEEAIESFRKAPPPMPVDEIAETIEFLRWLAEDNFTLLGMREYAFNGKAGAGGLERLAKTGLGILSNPDVKVLRRGRELVIFTPELREFLMQPAPLIVTKANVRSRIHRRVHMDYVGIKLFSADGDLTGELRLVGLFTSSAYNRSARNIPFLRRKVDHVLHRAGFDPTGHSGKALINVLEQFPRDELFQIDLETLTRFALAILQLDEHPRLRVLTRPDKFDRFVSVMVYVPRDHYSTQGRAVIGEYLAKIYEGRISAYYPAFLEGALVRVHYIIGRYEGKTPDPPERQLETDIGRLLRTWDNNVHAVLARGIEPQQVQALLDKYRNAFSIAYQEAFAAEDAVQDIAIIDKLTEDHRIAIDFVPHSDRVGDSARLRLKLFHLGEHITLSSRVPMLEHMGFRVVNERTYGINPADSEKVWLHEMALETADGKPVALPRLGGPLEDCFMAVWRGAAENDGYNGLVLRGGLSWREVAILRAYSRYLRQAHIPFGQGYMSTTLNRHSEIAVQLIGLFRTRFDPDLNLDMDGRAGESETILKRIEEALQGVEMLDEDRIIRRFANLVMATSRTNVYQRDPDGAAKATMAFKIHSTAVEELPKPRPFAEIFVYSPRVEGVHLRFGEVARGGVRWSDRPHDFRTEVLGLAKAQQVKNAVIVPVGAKGGFVLKRPPAGGSREDLLAEGVAAYRIFVSSLLDLTDNLDGDHTIPPPRVVRHDGDDPYLVVAADKGTASFSDIANEISEGRHFWLGDAFASGGSAGYDHKKMAITARGAWEAIKRHFREIDVDIQTTPFTVVGIGDMSGDVFGNGMLLSPRIRLVAAFDHRDIFIDPDPDPAASLAERKQLFELPRSSWQDYDKTLISKGGGIFSRQDKAIPLSQEMRDITGLSKDKATPFEIINGLLKAKTELLWFGGIGTYVRASEESDEAVGDRANDAVRVTAKELRAKVVGEGANLGMTQRARIEFAAHGGRVNSDAIDNSAGVNTSDLEVNIKIALGAAVRAGKLSVPDRNRLLAKMARDVAKLVLRNNYMQTLAISLGQNLGLADFEFQARFMRDLEARSLLDRAVENLPDDAALAEREKQGRPLTRPEIAILIAYAKITLYNDLLTSNVPDDSYLGAELMRYFPAAARERFADEIHEHRLRREIIATMLANSMINRCGPTMINRLTDETGADVPKIAAAFAAARDSFQMTALNSEIDALDNKIVNTVQLELYGEVQSLLLDEIAWFLRNAEFGEGLAALVERYREGIEELSAALDSVLPAEARTRLDRARERLGELGVPARLAERISALEPLAMAPDIVLVAGNTGKPVDAVARAFFAVGAYFETDRIVELAHGLDIADYFGRLALNSTLDNLADAQRRLTAQVLATGEAGETGIEKWAGSRRAEVERTRRSLREIAGDGALTFSKLAVGASLLHDLLRR
ncbi:MAG: NAD-glutamate dehydrogenase [Hyphomicrobiales bacterium]|nr:NAD-glutamate dehydrogenase [Hyphomicrobiales bacterium]